MEITLTPKMLRHMDTFVSLKKTHLGARNTEAILLMDAMIEAREEARLRVLKSDQEKKQAQAGTLTRVTVRLAVEGIDAALATKALPSIRGYRPRKGNRQVLKAEVVPNTFSQPPDSALIIETVNVAAVQVTQDAVDWLVGKSLGQGNTRPGKLDAWGLTYRSVRVLNATVETI